jgi:hypothetical protein
MTHMIFPATLCSGTMLVRLTAQCQGGSIAAPIVERIRDGIRDWPEHAPPDALTVQPSAPTFARRGFCFAGGGPHSKNA